MFVSLFLYSIVCPFVDGVQIVVLLMMSSIFIEDAEDADWASSGDLLAILMARGPSEKRQNCVWFRFVLRVTFLTIF